MILLDYSAITIANVSSQKLPPDENLLRHMILNSLRAYNKKYRTKYGDLVICCDDSSWRKGYFPPYKYSRKKTRAESDIDWPEMFRIINKITDEIRNYLPFKVIQQTGAEADDIVATLALSRTEFGQTEPVMILAADGDYKQLQMHKNIKQTSTLNKKLVKESEPQKWLFEACVRGQSKDGVPNIYSPGDFFKRKADGEDVGRQATVSKKKLASLWDNRNNLEEFMAPEQWSAYSRNKVLMDLTKTPEDIKEAILGQYENYEVPGFSGVMNYLIKNRCGNLLGGINDFKQGNINDS